ncbi:rRNA-processing protein UTP23-like protein [Dinothrombium tinctorium]|uniref:rRNA-processing protein UTP23 homolog n=1 Tax=Dinothrombium tinctorium TaxID=1965070 RepID=A0A3S3SPE5_9ACAR|nr:rRNA-processing protein UTP23-like protein [Dinothrombium tinctorium]
MKVKRYKKVNRILTFYRNNYGFRTPYQLLIDGTFCQMALRYKVNLKEQLAKYLGEDTKLFTTVCVVTETEKIGPAVYGAMLIVKQFNIRKCGHEKHPIAASDCLLSMVKADQNADHYFIATQDPQLTQEIRQLPGVPLLYLKCNAINLEKPSEISEKHVEQRKESESSKDYQMEVLKKLKEQELSEEEGVNRKKRRPKGPNPLSCKPKKKKQKQSETQLSNESHEIKKKRKRKRTKVAKHVKQLLQSNGISLY